MLGGRLAERYGSKWVFGVSILSGGIGSILAPTAARLHYGVFIALRALQGFFQVGNIVYVCTEAACKSTPVNIATEVILSHHCHL